MEPFQEPLKGKHRGAANKGSRKGVVHNVSEPGVNDASSLLSAFQFKTPRPQQRTSSFDRQTVGNNSKIKGKTSKHSQGVSKINRMTRYQHCAANNRFSMSPFIPELQPCLYDPDAPLPWEFVQLVTVFVEHGDNSGSSAVLRQGLGHRCPICLDCLTIPHITRCGHVFCLTCALRYLNYSWDGQEPIDTKKCPVCNHPLNETELRPAEMKYTDTVTICEDGQGAGARNKVNTIGDKSNAETFTMQLMVVEKGSMYPHPVHVHDGDVTVEKDGKDDDEISASAAPYSRLHVASYDSVHDLYKQQRVMLLALHKECLRACNDYGVGDEGYADAEYLPAVELALERLHKLERKFIENASKGTIPGTMKITATKEKSGSGTRNSPLNGPSTSELLAKSAAEMTFDDAFPTLSTSPPPPPPFSVSMINKESKQEESQIHTPKQAKEKVNTKSVSVSVAASEVSVTDALNQEAISTNTNANASAKLYFYQAVSGANIFLHPLCMRAIKEGVTRKELVSLPIKLEANVLESESIRIDTSTRSRYPFLKHFPEHCDGIQLLEIDMRRLGLLSKSTLALYKDEFNKRINKRKKRKQMYAKEAVQDIAKDVAHVVHVNELKERHLQLEYEEEQRLKSLFDDAPAITETDNVTKVKANSTGWKDNRGNDANSTSFASAVLGGYFPSLGDAVSSKTQPLSATATSVPVAWAASARSVPASGSGSTVDVLNAKPDWPRGKSVTVPKVVVPQSGGSQKMNKQQGKGKTLLLFG